MEAPCKTARWVVGAPLGGLHDIRGGTLQNCEVDAPSEGITHPTWPNNLGGVTPRSQIKIRPNNWGLKRVPPRLFAPSLFFKNFRSRPNNRFPSVFSSFSTCHGKMPQKRKQFFSRSIFDIFFKKFRSEPKNLLPSGFRSFCT